MTGEEIDLFKDISLPIIVGIITTGICGLLAYTCARRIRIFLRGLRINILNDDFKLRLFYEYSFTIRPRPMSSDVFETLKNKLPQYDLSKISIRSDAITLKSNKLGGRINIQVFSQSESLAPYEGEHEPIDTDCFELKISLSDDLRLSYRQLNDLLGYLMIFASAKEIVRHYCFGNTQERTGFIVCDVVRNYDPIGKEKKLNLTEKNATITFIDKTMKIVLTNHEYLEKIIRDYIAY